MDLRSHFTALGEGLAHFDGPGGTQVPASVADAVGHAYRSAISNRHGGFASSDRADAIVDEARQAVADLLGAEPEGVIFGGSMTANTYVLAGALQKTWTPGDNVVLSKLDHDANIRPWVQAAERREVEVRWAVPDASTDLPADQYEDLVDERTRLVAVTVASNATGSMPDTVRIAQIAHASGALVHLDGVHATPHGPVRFEDLGADFYACSAYKFYGPHLGATVARPELLETLHPDKLLPSSNEVPDRFELGTSQFAQLVAVHATIDWIAQWGQGTTRRERLLDALAQIKQQEEQVFARLLDGLRSKEIRLIGDPRRRTPTVAFVKDGESPQATASRLADKGVAVWAGHYYAIELMTLLGLPDGAVRAGVVGYTSDNDVDRLLELL
ncbi:MAG: cysteine desulfurase-like protein [Frankiales bacterium]|nr:cysteine desulfurase-like protein [Frankiales bacterium]